jgi:hypothetical protein
MAIYDVWIPSNPHTDLGGIVRGSGIVSQGRGYRGDSARVEVYYEGNLYGAENLSRYADRVMHAADRLSARYPTVARAVLDRHSLNWIGQYSTAMGKVMIESPGSRRALADWLGVEEIPETELNL